MIMLRNVDASGYRRFHENVLSPALFATRGGGGVRRGPSSAVSSPRASLRCDESGRAPAFLRLSARAACRSESLAACGSYALVNVRITSSAGPTNSNVTRWLGDFTQ